MSTVSYFDVAKLIKQKVEMGEKITNVELEHCLEVIGNIANFASGYGDKILLSWAAQLRESLWQIKQARFNSGYKD